MKFIITLIACAFVSTSAGLLKPKPLTIETVKQEITNYQIEHGDVVLAQAILETGWFMCKGCCLDNNNIFGWSYDGKNYLKFKNWDESVGMYKIWQVDNYTEGEDYYEFLKHSGYAGDTNYIGKLKSIVAQLKSR